MDHLASLMSFLVVILVIYASFLSPFTAEARSKLVDQGNNNNHHHVKPRRPSTPTKVPPPPPHIHNDYWPPPAQPLPPSLPMPPAPSPYYNGIAPVPSSAPPQSSSSPPLPQSGDDYDYILAQPSPDDIYIPEIGAPDWTPPGYYPKNGGFSCDEGPCWDSQYCDYPCTYCGSNHTCVKT